MTATLSLVVQDSDGARAALPAGAVVLDGAPHDLAVAVPPDVQVVAVDTRVSAAGDADDPDLPSMAAFDLDVTLRGATLSPGGTWSPARPPSSDYVVAALDRITADRRARGRAADARRHRLPAGTVLVRGHPDGARVRARRRRARGGLGAAGGRARARGRRRRGPRARSDPGAREGRRHRRLHPLAAPCGGAAGRRGHVVPRHPQPGQPRHPDRRVVGRRHPARRCRRDARRRGDRPGDRPHRRGARERGRSPARGAAGRGRPAGRRRRRAHVRRDRAAHHDRPRGA